MTPSADYVRRVNSSGRSSQARRSIIQVRLSIRKTGAFLSSTASRVVSVVNGAGWHILLLKSGRSLLFANTNFGLSGFWNLDSPAVGYALTRSGS